MEKTGNYLKLLERTSKKKFGFWTSHITRHFEYPWLLEQMEHRKPGKCIDIGAGRSPLPIILDEWGWDVYTVDNAHKTTEGEWGYHQYGNSFNGLFTDFKTRKRFEIIYSVSVIEHLTAQERKKTIKHIYKLLKAKGVALLSIDLRHKTNNLWNKNYGQKIEDDHGTAEDVMEEMEAAGFSIDSLYYHREIKGIPIDTMYLTAVK